MIKPIVLLILDGWGLAPTGPGNALSIARLDTWPALWNNYPHTELSASGESVGLPPGEDGNTETGHLNIGAGRIVYQDLPRINLSIQDGSFFQNEAFLGAMNYAIGHMSNIHLMGLLSDSGVHASREHLYALLRFFKDHGCHRPVYLHLFTDGRDSPPNAAKRFITEVESTLTNLGIGAIASIIGRYYGMDRDMRWERTEKAYNALTKATTQTARSALELIEQSYANGKTDEFIEPTIILGKNGQPLPRISNHDAVIFYNYRIDRPRQLTRAFTLPGFEEQSFTPSFDPYAIKYYHKHQVVPDSRNQPFHREITLPNLFFVTMTEYERGLPAISAFPPQKIPTPIGSVYEEANIRQLHVSETEKERFVTYYFNGIREVPFRGEDRLIIPSPKVATYDLTPQMSANELTDKVIDRLNLGMYGFIVINYANPDMVAHTGNIQAAVRAVENVDQNLAKLIPKILEANGTCVITADHGNVEEMLSPDGAMDTEHSTYPVPFIMIDKNLYKYPHELPKGKLSDIAPTILAFASLPIPAGMTGKNLLERIPT